MKSIKNLLITFFSIFSKTKSKINFYTFDLFLYVESLSFQLSINLYNGNI